MAAIGPVSIHFLQFRIQYSSIALVYYDYAITFPDEVRYIWFSKFRLSTILYIFCRYPLVANVLYLLGIANQLGSGLEPCFKVITAISILGRLAVIAAFTARTYAVYGKDWKILALLGSIGILCVVCDIITPVGQSASDIVKAALLIGMSVFEALASFLTVFRSSKMLRADGRPWGQQHNTFAFLVFKQSIQCFGLISIVSIVTTILAFVAERGSFYQRLLNAFALPLSTTLTARFLISLRVWEAERVHGRGLDAERSLSVFQAASVAGQTTGNSGGTGALSNLLSDFGDDVRRVDAEKEDSSVIGKGKEKEVNSSEKIVEMSHLRERHANAV